MYYVWVQQQYIIVKMNKKFVKQYMVSKAQLTQTKGTPSSSNDTTLTNFNFLLTQSIPNISLGFLKQEKVPKLFKSTSKENIHFSFNPIIHNPIFTPKNMHSSSQDNKIKHSISHVSEQNLRNKSITKPTHNTISKDSLSLFIKKQKYEESKNNQQINQNMQNIKVFIRLKPIDISNQEGSCINQINQTTLRVQDRLFAFDEIFPCISNQEEVFQKIAKPLINRLFDGYNATIFAYGQTGSGKTHTMFGHREQQYQGIIPRAIIQIFSNVTSNKQNSYQISCSMLEIYKESLIDMLNPNKVQLKLKEAKNGVFVEHLSCIKIQNSNDCFKIIDQTHKHRRVATTKINESSSRSHTILTIYIKKDNNQCKLCLIDLAGSQKINKAGVSGENLEETKKINYSLSCLGNVINALTAQKKQNHIPFRDSKLTRILKDSLSGNFQTSIIVNCSANLSSIDQTLSSLKFAERAKKIKVCPKHYQKKGNDQSIQYLQSIIQKLTLDLNHTKQELTKYKNICERIDVSQKEIEPSARQIPSQRAYVSQNMKNYDREIPRIKKIQVCSLQNISSLNVSKSVLISGIHTPSLSSLSNRQSNQDISLSFSMDKDQDHSESQRLK